MIDSIFISLSDALFGNWMIALSASLGWGFLSILLSPCHLSSIPLIIGFIGSQEDVNVKRTFNISLVFSLGILLTIAGIGIITAALGRLIGDVGSIGNYIVAVVFFVVGLYLLDVIKLNWGSGLKGTKFKGLPAAFILGLLFGIGVGPCTFAFMAPVLGVVFETSKTNIPYSIALLSAFAVGHCLLIVIAGTLSGEVNKYLHWSESNKTVSILKKVCGILVIIGGIYMIYNTL